MNDKSWVYRLAADLVPILLGFGGLGLFLGGAIQFEVLIAGLLTLTYTNVAHIENKIDGS